MATLAELYKRGVTWYVALGGTTDSTGAPAGNVVIPDGIPELGIETFIGSNGIVTPLSIVAQPLTVPAGCYTVEIAPSTYTGDAHITFAGVAGISINATIAAAIDAGTTNIIRVMSGDLPFRIGVIPGDVLYFRGGASVAGSLRVNFLG